MEYCQVCLTNTEDFDFAGFKGKITADDQIEVDNLKTLIGEVTNDMDNFRYYLAAEKLYHYLWHNFADVIIEDSKNKLKETNLEEKQSTQYKLMFILKNTLTLLHPFMPFITEEIWSMIKDNKEPLLIVSPWPKTK